MGFVDSLIDNGNTPYAEIKIGGSKWKSDDAGIFKVDVNMGITGEASTCLISIMGKDRVVKKGQVDLVIDYDKIKLGTKLEVSLGYATPDRKKQELQTVFKGFVSDIAIELDIHGRSNAYITGMDGKMWLMATRETKSFGEEKGYSDAVKEIYNENSSYFSGNKIDQTPKLSNPIYMYDESYYDFCLRAAKSSERYFFVSLGKFYFADLTKSKLPTFTLTPEYGVKRAMFKSSSFGIPKSVEVKSIDAKDTSKEIKAEVNSVPAIGSGKSASDLTNNIKGKVSFYVEEVGSEAEAKNLAQSILFERSLGLVELEVEIKGYPYEDLEIAKGVKVKKFGDPFDNSYIVSNIHHICSFKNNNYTTIVKLIANKYSPQ